MTQTLQLFPITETHMTNHQGKIFDQWSLSLFSGSTAKTDRRLFFGSYLYEKAIDMPVIDFETRQKIVTKANEGGYDEKVKEFLGLLEQAKPMTEESFQSMVMETLQFVSKGVEDLLRQNKQKDEQIKMLIERLPKS